jgi:N-acyl-phosphatidylethanolamine-hydrolysing phospholipase D
MDICVGVKKWFLSCKIPAHQVIELDWHQEALIKIPRAVSSYSDSGYPPRHSSANDSLETEPLTNHYDDRNFGNADDGAALTLKVVCTPAQHRSGRGIFDHFKSLWSSWVVGVVASSEEGHDPFEDGAVNDAASERRFAPEDGFRMFFAGYAEPRYWLM